MRDGKTGILAQNPAVQARKLRLRWMLGASVIPLFGIVAAFGIAPQTAEQAVSINTVVEEVIQPGDLPPATFTVDEARPLWQADQVQRDDTLSSLLLRLNIRNSAAIDFLHHAPAASGLASQLRPGHSVLAKTRVDGTLVELVYPNGLDSALQVELTDAGYKAAQIPLKFDTQTSLKSGEIHSSLFSATDNAGIPDHIALQLADIFSSEIDFNLDLRKGDRFSVTYESIYCNGEPVKSGRVLSAEFINQGKAYQAVLYRDGEGHANYYTAEGKSLHKAFLRSPLEFSRISSGFSLARLHPVLQTMRAHKGVDYAAPIGTRIKAAADGTVAFVGAQGGYGNVIILQHAGSISTVYGHLSHFASGLHKGQRVSQGDVIGQVGMTGLATGPHLHYEFRVHGEHRDPLKVALPAAVPLMGAALGGFQAQSLPLLESLALLRHSNTAALD